MSVKFGITLGLGMKGFDAIGGAIKSTGALDLKLSKLKGQRVELGKKFGFASQKAKALNSDILKLTKTTKKLQKSMNLGKSMEGYRDKFKSSFMDKVALGATVIAPLKVAIDFESAMADVKKVVNFDSNKELKEFQKSITDLSTKIPLSAEGLAGIVASGGQLGIAKDKLLDFTKTTAKMSTAFDMLPDEAGEASAKLMNVFGLSVKEVGSLGDAMNHLSDNTASKAKDIVNVLARVGGSAKVFGLSAKETSSLAGAFLSLGKPAEVSATAINALLLKLGTADKQGSKFSKALGSMGLDAKQLKENIKRDGEGAIVDFLHRVNEVNQDDRMGLLSDMFGAEYSDDIALLSGGIDNYTKSISLLSEKQNYQGSMEKEFQARSATTANNLKLLGNTVSTIAINFGGLLLPAINSLLTPLKGLSSFFADMIERFPTLSKWVGGVTFGAIGLSLALAGAGFMGSFVVSGFANLSKVLLISRGILVGTTTALRGYSLVTAFATAKTKALSIWQGIVAVKTTALSVATNIYSGAVALSAMAIGGVGTALKSFGVMSALATAKQWLFNIALNANPIGLVITGIALLGAGVVWAYNKFDGFRGLIDTTWGMLKTAFSWSPLGIVMKSYGAVFKWLEGKFSWFKDSIESMKNLSSSVGGFFGLGDDEEESEKKSSESENVKKETGFFSSFFSEEKQSKNREINEVENSKKDTSIISEFFNKDVKNREINEVENSKKDINIISEFFNKDVKNKEINEVENSKKDTSFFSSFFSENKDVKTKETNEVENSKKDINIFSENKESKNKESNEVENSKKDTNIISKFFNKDVKNREINEVENSKKDTNIISEFFNKDVKNREINEVENSKKDINIFSENKESKNKETNKTENIINTLSTHKQVNSIDFKGLKKAVIPLALSTALVATPVVPPKLDSLEHINSNKQSLNTVQTTNNKALNSTVLNKNYTITLHVESSSASADDIALKVREAIKAIEDESRENSMEDTY